MSADRSRRVRRAAVEEAIAVADVWLRSRYVLATREVWIGRGLGSQLIDVAKDRRPSGLNLWTFRYSWASDEAP